MRVNLQSKTRLRQQRNLSVVNRFVSTKIFAGWFHGS